jgi:hypothetical protein
MKTSDFVFMKAEEVKMIEDADGKLKNFSPIFLAANV